MSRSSATPLRLSFFFFNDTATTEIYTLSLHDALPILYWYWALLSRPPTRTSCTACRNSVAPGTWRSEEHTSELQSRLHLVCRLLLEKKNSRAGIFRCGKCERHRAHRVDHRQSLQQRPD